ncbi:MAG: phosphatidate cytidylyltransferase [Deltaproteobacteria bacterium]|nr:phosphatidate cytidylyltransferase [Deltaproteobacteria bacterium]
MGRVIPGLLMVVLWVLLLFLAPPLIFWLVITLGALIGLSEYFRMIATAPGTGTMVLTIGICSLPVVAVFAGSATAVLIGGYLSLLGLVILVLSFYTRLDDVLSFLTSAGFGVFYISLCSAHLVLIRFLPDGASWLLLLTAITAASDTGAYYAGRAFGKRKLCPNISPGKTINGAVGGIVAAVLTAVILACFLLPGVNSFKLALAAAVLSGIGIAGDLTESIIKRGTGVKDSGTILGGHGGLLDRIDSLLLTAPLLYALLYFGVL